MPSNTNYLFKDYADKNEIINLINTSVPTKVKILYFTEVLAGHYSGEYAFYIKNTKGKNICIPFMDLCSDINDFWTFLEFLIQTDETSILYIDDDGNEQILYIETVDKTDVRFFIAETMEVYHRFCRKDVESYTFEDADILLDVIIPKKTLISQFYEKLLEIFDGWEKVTEFAPWATDINTWQKNSKIIENYLEQN